MALSDRPDTPVIVAGGSIGGLATALALGRLGRQVTVLERDELSEFADAEAAFAAERQGAPQAHQTHGFLARPGPWCCASTCPDILETLRNSGAESMTLTGSLGDPEPGDDDLSTLIVRRTTFEWVLREAVRREPGVTYRSDSAVAGLVRSDDRSGVPHVIGAHLADGTTLAGDVIACTGRRGAVPAWLSDVGVALAEKVSDTHIVYLTRWYRRPAGLDLHVDARLGGDFGYLKYLAIPCDGSTFSVTLAVRSKDTELRGMPARPRCLRPGVSDPASGPGPVLLLRRRGAPRPGAPDGRAHQPAALLHQSARRTIGHGLPCRGRCAYLHQSNVRTRVLIGLCPGHAAG